MMLCVVRCVLDSRRRSKTPSGWWEDWLPLDGCVTNAYHLAVNRRVLEMYLMEDGSNHSKACIGMMIDSE